MHGRGRGPPAALYLGRGFAPRREPEPFSGADSPLAPGKVRAFVVRFTARLAASPPGVRVRGWQEPDNGESPGAPQFPLDVFSTTGDKVQKLPTRAPCSRPGEKRELWRRPIDAAPNPVRRASSAVSEEVEQPLAPSFWAASRYLRALLSVEDFEVDGARAQMGFEGANASVSFPVEANDVADSFLSYAK